MGFPDGSVVKNLLANARDSGLIPRLGKPLMEGLASSSSALAWKIPGTEEPGGPKYRGQQSRTRLNNEATQDANVCQSLLIRSQDSIEIACPVVAPQNREHPFKDLTSHTPGTAKTLR